MERKDSVRIGDISITERNSGFKQAKFVIRLSDTMLATVQVAFKTGDITATVANNDYQSTTGTAIFEPGTITDTVL